MIAGLLTFGCLGPAPETQQPSGEQTTQPTAPTTPPGGETTTPTAPETTQPTEPTTEPPATGDGMDLTDLSYLELAALGVPVKCVITSTYAGTTTTGTLYMAGEDKVRMETPYDGKMLISLVLDTTMYVSNIMSDMYPDCEWLVIEHEETEGAVEEGGMTYESPTTELEELPSTDFECEAWAYDNSKFTPPTENVCTQEEFNDKIMEAYQ